MKRILENGATQDNKKRKKPTLFYPKHLLVVSYSFVAKYESLECAVHFNAFKIVHISEVMKA